MSSPGQSRRKKHKKASKKTGKIHPSSDSEQRDSSAQADDDNDSGKVLIPSDAGKSMTGLLNQGIDAVNGGIGSVLAAQKGAKKFLALRKRNQNFLANNSTIAATAMQGIDSTMPDDKSYLNGRNETLIMYFAELAESKDSDQQMDLERVEIILKEGANINCTDKFGQTVLHEAARAWEVDVAEFLVNQGADITQGDKYGRTPLHVASAVDYPDMIKFFLSKGANIECVTIGEHQTPLHYAAKNDACSSLRFLVKNGANIDARDFKGRTPLQIAAELDRSETAKLLLELGASASDCDNSGQTALVLMVAKMPLVAKLALNQFHRTDRANRLQFYYMQYVEPLKPEEESHFSQTAMAMIVHYDQLELIMHPVILRLIDIKWRKFGRRAMAKQVIFNLSFVLLWSMLAVFMGRNIYTSEDSESNLQVNFYMIGLAGVTILLTFYQIFLELAEYFASKKNFKKYREWRSSELERDMKYCHPRWPQEENYLLQEIAELNKQSSSYFENLWNWFDWAVYISLSVIITLESLAFILDSKFLYHLTKNLAAIIIVFVWLRLMKVMRGFRVFGPFIVMLGLIVKDIGVFGFLYMMFYLPYGENITYSIHECCLPTSMCPVGYRTHSACEPACSFWMTFGGANSTVTSMATVDQLAYSLFRLTLVDEYQYDEMREVNTPMTYILCASFLFLSAILCINLLIALLSNTFQRIYDNAFSNAVMQQASIILNVEEGLNKKRKKKFRTHIHHMCSPESLYYDDDDATESGEELKLMTFQIKDTLEAFQEEYRDSGHSTVREELEFLKQNFDELKNDQEKCYRNLEKDISTIKELVQTLLTMQNGQGRGKGGGEGGPTSAQEGAGQGDDILEGAIPFKTLTSKEDDEGLYEPPSPDVTPRPRFVHRRESKMDLSLFGAPPIEKTPEARVPQIVEARDSVISLRTAPVLQMAEAVIPGTKLKTSKERLKELRQQNKRRRKLRKEQEDYLMQQLTKESRHLQPGGHQVESDTDVSVKIDDEDDNIASKVRMHSTIVDETKEDV